MKLGLLPHPGNVGFRREGDAFERNGFISMIIHKMYEVLAWIFSHISIDELHCNGQLYFAAWPAEVSDEADAMVYHPKEKGNSNLNTLLTQLSSRLLKPYRISADMPRQVSTNGEV